MRQATVLALAAVVALVSAPAEAKVTRYLTGNPADVSPYLYGPAHDFGGAAPTGTPRSSG